MQLDERKLRAAISIYARSCWLTIGILQVIACCPKGTTGIRQYFPFTRPETTTYEVIEGDTVELICQSDNSSNVVIKGDSIQYIHDGKLRPFLSDNIDSKNNETSFVLILYNVTRNNADIFNCWPPNQNLNLKVLYNPSENYPLVTSNYTPQYCCDDESHGPFQFNCSTEVGDPPVNISIHIEKGGRNFLVHSDDYDITETDSLIYLSFVTYLNSSFNGARLVCSITQHLPVPYENFQKSRFFELSPRASINIHPSINYTITKAVEAITLTCTSNVSGFVLEWIGIPLEHTQYNISSVNDSIKLMIFDYGGIVNDSIIIQCRGSCGVRVMSQEVIISLDNDILEGNDGNNEKKEGNMMRWTFSSFIIIPIIILFAVFVVLVYRTKRDNTTESERVNKSNGNSIGSNLPTKRQQLMYHETENRDNQNDGEKVINEPIDEKEKIEGENHHRPTVRDSLSQESHSSIEMIENPKYQPYRPKTESVAHGKDGDYATVC